MKKTLLLILTILALVLAACGSNRTPSGSATPGGDSAGIPASTRLLLGSFRLEGTQQTITAEQAIELLPLWYVYAEVSTSDTAAQEEIDALIEQIQENMTTEQMRVLDAMTFTQQDVSTVMQEQGVVTAEQSATTQIDGGGPGGMGGPPGGDFMGGGPPGAGGGSGAGTGAQSGANPQKSPQRIGSLQIPSGLIEALIKLLENKTQP